MLNVSSFIRRRANCPYDGIPLDSAAGMRLMRSQYRGACLRAVRASDSAEMDIGFDSMGNVDLQQVRAFAGTSGTLKVKTLYDQSGNANHWQATQGATTYPRIVNAGVPDIYNGRLVLYQDITAPYVLELALATGTTFSFAYTARWISGSSGRILMDNLGTYIYGWQVANYARIQNGTGTYVYLKSNSDTNPHCLSIISTAGATTYGGTDGVLMTVDNAGSYASIPGFFSNAIYSNPSESHFMEMAVSKTAWTTQQMQRVESAQRRYYGTP